MKVLIIGGAGMVGRNLAEALVASGRLGDGAVSEITLFDVVPAATQGTDAVAVRVRTGDISDRATVDALVADRPEVIFHLAAIVSGEAEADFDKGYRINLDAPGTCSRRSELRRAITRAWSIPRPSRSLARPSPRRSGTSSSPRR